jgi:hypothetical protein
MSLGSVAVSAHEAAVTCTSNTSNNNTTTTSSSHSASAIAKQLPQPVYRYLPGRNNAARAAGKRDIHMFQKRYVTKCCTVLANCCSWLALPAAQPCMPCCVASTVSCVLCSNCIA